VFEGKEDYHKVSELIDAPGNKSRRSENISSALVGYDKEEKSRRVQKKRMAVDLPKKAASKTEPALSILRICWSGWRNVSVVPRQQWLSDLNRELRQHTFERYQTLRQKLLSICRGRFAYCGGAVASCQPVWLGAAG